MRYSRTPQKRLKDKGKLIFTTLNGLFPLFHSVSEFYKSAQKEGQSQCKECSFDLMTFRDHNTAVFEDDSGNKRELKCNERYYVPSEITWLLKTLGFKKNRYFWREAWGILKKRQTDHRRFRNARCRGKMKEDMKKVFIRTFGCQMNVRDSEVICGLLEKAGYEITAEPDKADIVLFNTCSVRQHAEDKVWSEMGRYGEKEPKSTRVQGDKADYRRDRLHGPELPGADIREGAGCGFRRRAIRISIKFRKFLRNSHEHKGTWGQDSSLRLRSGKRIAACGRRKFIIQTFTLKKSMPTW